MNNQKSPSLERSSQPAHAHFVVSLPADITAISPVIAWVMRLVNDMQYGPGKEFEIETALREALANAITHGCKGDPAKKIECSVTDEGERGILIIVRDPGHGFEPSAIPSPTDDANLLSEHGRGIYLINKLMDEVTYERNGSEIRMRKL